MAEYHVDDATLRDAPRDPAAAAAELDALLAAGPDGDPADPLNVLAWHTAVGNLARSLRRLDLAERHQLLALRLAERHAAPPRVVAAMIRYAHVLQWQDRFDEARALFADCLAAVGAGPVAAVAHFVHQHAGKCEYDAGDWATAHDHFSAALALREAIGDPELVASSRQALTAATACLTAVAAAAELHRLVPAVHAAARPAGAVLLAPVRPYAGFLVDLRTALLAGSVPIAAARAVHRYHLGGLDDALPALVDGGWLEPRPDAVVATDRCRAVLGEVMALFDRVCTAMWGTPSTALASVRSVLAAATAPAGQDGAFALHATAGHPGDGTVAGRLFTALCTLRYHRADAHAAAWSAAGLTADQVTALPADDPTRRRIEAETDRLAAQPYRSAPTTLVDDLRALPDTPTDR